LRSITANVGTLERLGLGEEVLKTLYPRLIHCAVRAFPDGVADADLPGYEASIQAYTGIMHATGEHGREPVRCGPSMVDLSTGLSALISILVALRERDRLGTGQYVEPALLRTATQLLGPQVTGYFMAEVLPVRYGSGHERLVPYQNFQCSDGFLLIAAGNDRLWEKLCKVLAIADGADGLPYPTLASRTRNREVVVTLVASRVAQRTRSELRQALGAAGIPCAPVNDIGEYLSQPGLREAGVLQPLSEDGQFTLPGMLFGSETVPAPQRTLPPATGEHTVEILAELGIGLPEIERLRAQGTIR
jgi:crotonobetainyl-CoA:carnitine CoA-transferase CaiB-like acyl-CoA transferase